MNIWFLFAGALSAAVCAMHVVMGGREAARPLLASTELDQIAKYTNYYCWHLVTIIIAALAVAFFVAAINPEARDIALFAVITALTFSAWSLGMIARFRLPLLPFGQWILFVAIASVGGAGLALP